MLHFRINNCPQLQKNPTFKGKLSQTCPYVDLNQTHWSCLSHRPPHRYATGKTPYVSHSAVSPAVLPIPSPPLNVEAASAFDLYNVGCWLLSLKKEKRGTKLLFKNFLRQSQSDARRRNVEVEHRKSAKQNFGKMSAAFGFLVVAVCVMVTLAHPTMYKLNNNQKLEPGQLVALQDVTWFHKTTIMLRW